MIRGQKYEDCTLTIHAPACEELETFLHDVAKECMYDGVECPVVFDPLP